MRWALAMVACAACGDGGAGVTLESVATLPYSTSYAIGFEADGTPIVGFTEGAVPLLRFDGDEWVPHPITTPLQVLGFGSDADGTPVVLLPGLDVGIRVVRLERGRMFPLGGDIPGRFTGVFQSASGTRYLLGDEMRILRPGALAWEHLPHGLIRGIRGADGKVYASSWEGFFRLEDDGTVKLMAPCVEVDCATFDIGLDAGGRFYINQGTAVTIFEPGVGMVGRVVLPEVKRIAMLGVTERHSLLVTEPPQSNGSEVFAIADDHTATFVHNEPPLDARIVELHTDPAGTLYVTQDDWLGRVVVSP